MTFVKGDYGATILRALENQNGDPIDISGATTRQCLLRSPSGTVTTRTATFTSGGVDGRIQYVLVAADLSVAGPWQIQFKLSDGSTFQIATPPEDMQVLEALA